MKMRIQNTFGFVLAILGLIYGLFLFPHIRVFFQSVQANHYRSFRADQVLLGFLAFCMILLGAIALLKILLDRPRKS